MQYDKETLRKLWDTELEILKEFIRICDKYSIDWFVAFGTSIGAVRHKGFIPWDDDMDVGMLYKDFVKFMEVAKTELGDQYNILNTATNKEYACTVTKLEKKGTAFVSDDTVKCKVKPGINIDIFTYYPLSDDQKKAEKQYRKAWFYGRLLFLRGEGIPYLEFGGIKAAVCRFIFKAVHIGLCVFGVSKTFIYKKLLKASLMCENEETKRIAPLESPYMRRETLFKEFVFPLGTGEFEGIKVKVPANEDKVLTAMYGDYMKLPPKEKRETHRPYFIDFGKEEVNV